MMLVVRREILSISLSLGGPLGSMSPRFDVEFTQLEKYEEAML